MKILAIESSCDETSAAVVEKNRGQIKVLSNITATSLAIHAKTGGIIPENAAREQVKYIIPVIKEALDKARGGAGGRVPDTRADDFDAIAVTYGPGLIGSLLVGVETAKTLSYVYNKPLIPVNHLLAHLFANFISTSDKRSTISFPFIGLIVSGGHTDLLYFKSVEDYKWLGGTRDDAAGEALDKIGRLLGLSYPAGAEIEHRALLFSKSQGSDTIQPRGLKRGSTSGKVPRFHAPLIGKETFDFSFSGLKTEVLRYVNNELRVASGGGPPSSARNEVRTSDGGGATTGPAIQEINEICFAVQKAVIDVLVRKTLSAAEKYKCRTILLGGGVAANSSLIEKLKSEVRGQKQKVEILSPEKIYCTDNAAMIGAYALLNPEEKSWKTVSANPDLYFM